MSINDYFDNVYLLNLQKRTERFELSKKRLNFCEIDFEKFGATDGSVMNFIWNFFSKENSFFKNSNYLGCAISHLSIYKDALEKGYEKILILEDDNRVRYDANDLFSKAISKIPSNWELLYLGFIPLSDDCSRWDYNIFSIVEKNVSLAKNFWGLYAYGITSSTMKNVLETYDKEFPMELDRFFVNHIQPKNTSYGIIPQIFAADDGISDNSKNYEHGMLVRSTDSRFSKLTEYI